MKVKTTKYFDGDYWWYFFKMADKKEEASTMDNFKSTVDLVSNPGFQSSLSIASKDLAAHSGDKKYDPFSERQVEHPNSTIGAFLHLLKACLGSGILAMPSAFKNSGLIIGSFGTIIAGVLCTHTVAMVVRTSQEACVDAKKPSMGYAETCGAAFTHGPKSIRSWGGVIKVIVDYSLALTYFSVLCVYVVFIGSSLEEVIKVYYPETFSTSVYCALTYLPLVLICQIRNLKHLVPFSALANFLMVVVFGITMFYMFKDLPPVQEREYVASISQWPLFISTVIFAMEGIGVVMPIENEMKNPRHFLGCPGVLNIAMVIVIGLYGTFGFFGYLQFGSDVLGSITLNLPESSITAQSAKLLMAIVIFFSYALQFYVPMEMINRMLNKNGESKYDNIVQITVRTLIVTASVALAAAFPDLELVIGLTGAIFFSTLGLLFPAIIDTVYRWDRDLGFWNYILWKNIIIGIIAVFALVSGSYVSIAKLLEPAH